MWKASRAVFVSSVIAASALAAPYASAVEADTLAGNWRGGGSVSFSSGAQERAHCRASFSPTSKTSYDYQATCATQSGTASASGHVRGNGTNFHGSFYNAEFDANGTIAITVSGRSQTVRLLSSKGSALLRLSR